MTTTFTMTAGRAAPLGASFDGDGVNFAVFSENATRMQVCLFSEDGKKELAAIDLPERDGDVWHGYVSGLRPGQQYGLRAHGPYAPEQGHRFNPHKLLIDPYAKRLTGHPTWDDRLMGYVVGDEAEDLAMDTRDSAPVMPRCVVEDPSFSWGEDTPPQTPIQQSVIYEAHVKGFTAKRLDVDAPGTFLGMASDPMLEYLTDLGITAIELLPAQAFLNDRFLTEKGLTNYWGYQTLGFFAPEPRYLHRAQISEFQQMVARFHTAGIEVIMDVVYNHTCEGNELGPTLAFKGLDNASYYRLTEDPRYYINDTGTGNCECRTCIPCRFRRFATDRGPGGYHRSHVKGIGTCSNCRRTGQKREIFVVRIGQQRVGIDVAGAAEAALNIAVGRFSGTYQIVNLLRRIAP
ncbi:hypothetical protein LCGC14_1995950 [marine sediment metagenome]|uniref:Glycosyl hydrolase family 13 catalytic domain-containing protein n=1 Tax=marine sediment metagenome TaxID=412755 RepID=A0A0F9F4X7_9ZZZZ